MSSKVVVVLVVFSCPSPGGVLHPELMSLTKLQDDCAGACLEVSRPKTGTDPPILVLQVHVRIACNDVIEVIRTLEIGITGIFVLLKYEN